jgi:hypothetical protein
MIYTKTAKKIAEQICLKQIEVFGVKDPVLNRFAETGNYEPGAWIDYLKSVYDAEKKIELKNEINQLKQYFLHIASR